MTFLIVLGIYFAILFAIFFVMKRSFGLPALGLAAGALLAGMWAGDLTPLIAQAGFAITSPPLLSIVEIGLTLLPAFLLMPRSKQVHGLMERVGDSLLFALLATMLTYSAFASAVVLDSQSAAIVQQFLPYSQIIITICLILAIVSILVGHTHHAKPGRPHK